MSSEPTSRTRSRNGPRRSRSPAPRWSNLNYASPYADLARGRIVVTGGRGTLGGAVARACSGLGATVWSLDVSPVKEELGKVRERVASVRDRAALEIGRAHV